MLTAASPNPRRVSILVIILHFVSLFFAVASVPDTFTEGNFQILLPDGWSSDASRHPYKLSNGDGSKVILINPVQINSTSSLNQPGRDLKMAHASGTGFVSSYGHLTISGTNFIAYDKQQLDPDHKGILYQRFYYTEVNGYGITILTQTLNGVPPKTDTEIMGIMNSFNLPKQKSSPVTIH